MKLRKNIQVVLVVIFFISFLSLAVAVDSEWSVGVVRHLITNTLLALTSGSLLVIYGRWE